MPDEPGTLRKVAWQELFPGVILLQALRLATNFRVLVLSAVGMVGTTAGWLVLASLLSNPDDLPYTRQIENFARWPWELMAVPRSPIFIDDPFNPGEPAQYVPDAALDWALAARYMRPLPPVQVLHQLSDPVVRLFAPSVISLRLFVFLLLCALWALVVWSLVGGAITRIAALALAREQRLPAGHALEYARSKYLSYFTAPLYPLIGALLVALPVVLLGLLLRFAAGTVIAGILWPLVIVAGVLMATLLVGLFFGWPLMWATISTEGSDWLDALSRSYSYTYQRPLHYLFYVLIAWLLGVLGWTLVSIFAGAVIDLSDWAVSWGSGQDRWSEVVRSDPAQVGGLLGAGGTLIRFWIHCVEAIALAFVSAYFWTAATAIYFLLRWHVDNTELDEALTSEGEEPYGLPPLKPDAAGVPDVADEAAVGEAIEDPKEPATPASDD